MQRLDGADGVATAYLQELGRGSIMRDYRAPSRWPVVVLVGLVLGFVALAVWWLESRFDAEVAIMVVGGTLGVLCVFGGWLLAISNQKITLGSAAQFNDRLAATEGERQRTRRADLRIAEQYARMEREAFNQRAGIEAYGEKQMIGLARQLARSMAAAERQAELARPTWDQGMGQMAMGWR